MLRSPLRLQGRLVIKEAWTSETCRNVERLGAPAWAPAAVFWIVGTNWGWSWKVQGGQILDARNALWGYSLSLFLGAKHPYGDSVLERCPRSAGGAYATRSIRMSCMSATTAAKPGTAIGCAPGRRWLRRRSRSPHGRKSRVGHLTRLRGQVSGSSDKGRCKACPASLARGRLQGGLAGGLGTLRISVPTGARAHQSHFQSLSSLGPGSGGVGGVVDES